jgi:hypothetical protein
MGPEKARFFKVLPWLITSTAIKETGSLRTSFQAQHGTNSNQQKYDIPSAREMGHRLPGSFGKLLTGGWERLIGLNAPLNTLTWQGFSH